MVCIKVCGITRKEDARVLSMMPIWAMGFIQVEASPRYIRPEMAKEIIRTLPTHIVPVGVFQNENIHEIKCLKAYCGFQLVQLHGEESPSLCSQLRGGVIRAFGVGEKFDGKALPDFFPVVDYLLFDTQVRGKSGGTGRPFPWNTLQDIDMQGKPFIIAGGLSEKNVFDCLRAIHPFAVDLNSGVELFPGKKDVEKIKNLLDRMASCSSKSPLL
ncbi:MAG: phosphoribosylanthranilate isomerase [Candidatus Atribacteria bacterium]|nr:phosphoribosylanthranilate isomerase [Candidatus Atribacteria bacterium]